MALVWTQFLPPHADRIEAVAARLAGKAEVTGVEIAATSDIYGDFAVQDGAGRFTHQRLFPGGNVNAIAAGKLLWRMLRSLARHDIVCLGVPYSVKTVLLLVPLLRLIGCRVYLVYDSKFDDRPRSAWFELAKAIALSSYSGAIVASPRSREYLRFLGFRKRPILGGSNGVSLARLRAEADAGRAGGAPADFAARDFVFVGRLAEEKNLPFLLEGFARFAAENPASTRRLKLIGSGPCEAGLRAQAAHLGVADRVDFAGFMEGPPLAAALADALALVLVSRREPWGFVINEAAALGVPAVASEMPGARDVLVRNLVTGFTVPAGATDSLAAALARLDDDPALWQAMSTAAQARARLGDCECFADAVELLIDPAAQPAGERMAQMFAAFGEAR